MISNSMTSSPEAVKRRWLKTTKPLREGQVRIKSWRVGVVPPQGSFDETWTRRCQQYWDLQQRLYGYRVRGSFTMEFNEITDPSQIPGDPDITYTVCTTSVVVGEVLPGPRVDKEEWTRWRLANPNVE